MPQTLFKRDFDRRHFVFAGVTGAAKSHCWRETSSGDPSA